MTVVIGVLVAAFVVALGYGLVSRRIPLRQDACCAPADPLRDRRIVATLDRTGDDAR